LNPVGNVQGMELPSNRRKRLMAPVSKRFGQGFFILATTGKLLRIFINEADRWHGRPLSTAIVEALRGAGFVGATVLKGIEGYGVHRTLHSARVVDFSTNLPILIEVIEEESKIAAFLPMLKEMVAEGLLTLENVQIIRVAREGS